MGKMYRAQPQQMPGEAPKRMGDRSGLWRVAIEVFDGGWKPYSYASEDVDYETAFKRAGELNMQFESGNTPDKA